MRLLLLCLSLLSLLLVNGGTSNLLMLNVLMSNASLNVLLILVRCITVLILLVSLYIEITKYLKIFNFHNLTKISELKNHQLDFHLDII